MEARLENKLSMIVSVTDTMDENQSLWQSVAAIGTTLAAVKRRVANINTLSQTRNVSTKGVTLSKQAARDGMELLALDVAGAVRAYASATDDNELFEKANYTPSDLVAARDTDVSNLCQGIHTTANGSLAKLADFGVTEQKLADLQAKITAYAELVGKPRSKRSSTKAAGQVLDVEFEATDKLLAGQLDGLLEQFKATQPLFYAAYKAARSVVDNAAGHSGKNGSNGQDTQQPPQ